jgi:hypothetical protein
VVHRDLTPGNVQLCEDGQVKLLDLGLAAALGRRRVEGGTPAYMAPEQVEGAPEDERTDVYALGVLLYRMLTGVAPFEVDGAGRPRSGSRGLEVVEAPALAMLVESMLAPRPTERPRDAGVVLEALQEIEASLPRAGTASGGGLVRIRRPARARWLGAGVALGLAAAALAALPLLWWRGPARPAGPGASLVLSGSSTMTTCAWRMVAHMDFDHGMERLAWRNGKFGGQAARLLDGEPAWRQDSDWNQAFFDLGDLKPDVFAVVARLLVPAGSKHQISAGMVIFTDPVGGMDSTSSDVAHGEGFLLTQEPGRAAGFQVGAPGTTTTRIDHRGLYAGSFTGEWRTLRIEGSRSGCWLRVLVDDQLVVARIGCLDLSGHHVMLGGNAAAYQAAEVTWKHLNLLEGDAGCQ